jgi:Na+/H+-dicarboxylate symporter
MKLFRISLLVRVAIAIVSGILLGQIMPDAAARLFVTFNSLFGNFLSFAIPLIILGLVAPAIGELGKGAGRLLVITALIAYGSTIFSGFFTYFTGSAVFPHIITASTELAALENPENLMLQPFFTLAMPPLMDIMTALLLAFIIGLGVAAIKGDSLRAACTDFRDIIMKLIESVIIPLLPLHIFGIFLNITVSGQVAMILFMFIKVIAVIFVLHAALLLIQFTIAGITVRRNPLKLLVTMLPAYMTALGTQSSAATIPVTLRQVLKNGVREQIAVFTVPLCATIHLAGSAMKIVACAMAIMIMTGQETDFISFGGFILMLGITMVAAPGVPGGAIMAALGLLGSMLGFNETLQALMIALYIAMDSFGTACNVTGDGAIALIVDKISSGSSGDASGRCKAPALHFAEISQTPASPSYTRTEGSYARTEGSYARTEDAYARTEDAYARPSSSVWSPVSSPGGTKQSQILIRS